MRQLAIDAADTPQQHPAYPRLTADQKRAINEVWDDVCVPALEEVAVMRRQVTDARIAAQDARHQAAVLRDELARLRWETRPDA